MDIRNNQVTPCVHVPKPSTKNKHITEVTNAANERKKKSGTKSRETQAKS